MSLVLGIDPSLDRTGYAVVRAATRRVVEAGVIRPQRRAALPARLAELSGSLDELLGEYAVEQMAVEDLYAHYRHPRTAILMGHARGVVLLAAARRGVTVRSFSATRVKKSLTGNGHASKTQMQRAIAATLGLPRPPEPSDVADAIAVALCAIQSDR